MNGSVGAQDHEHVREAAGGYAEVAGRPFDPVFLDASPVSAADVGPHVVAVDGVEAGGEHEDVEFVQGAVLGDDALLRHPDDRVFLDAHQRDVGAVERLEIPGVAQRAARVEVVRGQLARGLGVLHDLGDLAADELRRLLVGRLVGGDVVEGFEHEPEPAALVPRPLVDAFALLRGDFEGSDGALLEAHGDAGVAHLVPGGVEVVAVGLNLFRRQLAVAGRHAVLRGALERGQVLGDRRGGADHLVAGRAVADDTHPLAVQIQLLGPGAGMHDRDPRSARCRAGRGCSSPRADRGR